MSIGDKKMTAIKYTKKEDISSRRTDENFTSRMNGQRVRADKWTKKTEKASKAIDFTSQYLASLAGKN
jgi:hypothetical protein